MAAHAERRAVLDPTMQRPVTRYWPAIGGSALLAILIYLPSLRFEFVGWDDTRYITDSPLITQPGGLIRFWTTGEAEQYYPLTFTTFWIEYQLWGDDPSGYHATNVLLHALNTALLLLWLRGLGLERWPACAVSLLFALHPVQVQSVAWIAQRKNLLSTVFVLVSLIAWTRFRATRGLQPAQGPEGVEPTRERDGPRRSRSESNPAGPPPRTMPIGLPEPWHSPRARGWYLVSLTAFIAAMLCKSAVLTLPLVLAALDRWVWQVSLRRTLSALGPWLVPVAVLAATTVRFERSFTGVVPDWATRVPAAAAAVWFYVAQCLAPLNLSPMHPRWNIVAGSFAWWLPVAALFGALAAIWHGRRLRGMAAFAIAWFLAFLLPVLGLVAYGNVALTYVSDHYLYLPSIGLFLIIGLGIERVGRRGSADRSSRNPPAWAILAGIMILMALSLQTVAYLPTFSNAETMWSRVLAGNPVCPAAHAGLGRVFENRKYWNKALDHYQRVVELAPHVEASLDLARALRHLDRTDDAGSVLLDARQAYPQSAAPIVEMARMAQRTGRYDAAERLYLEALAADPSSASLHVELAALYLGLLRREDAEARFREALAIEPRHARAHLGLATSLRGQHRFDEAVVSLRAAVLDLPQDVSLLNLLARILATAPYDPVRNGSDAVAFAKRADRIKGNIDYEVLDTLAAAYAEAGRWDHAVETAGRALALAQSGGDEAFAAALRDRMEQYRNHTPLREVTTTIQRRR